MTPEPTTTTTKRRGRYNNGRQAVDCSGKQFGNWTVINRAGSDQGDATWYCQCHGTKPDGSTCGAKAIKPRRSLVAAERNEQTYCRECDPRKTRNAQ